MYFLLFMRFSSFRTFPAKQIAHETLCSRKSFCREFIFMCRVWIFERASEEHFRGVWQGSRKKSHEDKIPCRKKSHEEKIPEEKIPLRQNPRGQNPIRTKSHQDKISSGKNPTRKYSIVLVSLEYILISQFSNMKNLRIFFITYPFFAHYLCFTFIFRWRACTRLCSFYLRNTTNNST